MTSNERLLSGARTGNLQQIKEALAKKANIHIQEDSALCWASYGGYFEVVELLLKAGADVHACNGRVLHWAKINNHTKVVKLLEKHIKYLGMQPKQPMHPILYKYSRKDKRVLEVLNRQRN